MLNYITINEFILLKSIFGDDLETHILQANYIIGFFRRHTMDNKSNIDLNKEKQLVQEILKIRKSSKNKLRDIFGVLRGNFDNIITI